MINKIDAFLRSWSQEILSAQRIVAAFMFTQHGGQKLFGFPVASAEEFHLFSLDPGMAGVLEIIGGPLLFLGLFTRPVAFVLSGLMAFAYFIGHAPNAFWTLANRGDSSVLYCFIFLYIASVGGGSWSLDNLLRHKASPGNALGVS